MPNESDDEIELNELGRMEERAELADKKVSSLEAKLEGQVKETGHWWDEALRFQKLFRDTVVRAESAEKAYLQACRERETERVLKEQAVELLRNRYGDYQLWG